MNNKTYEQMMKSIKDIFELFGVDKNIISDKLDSGEVSQIDFDNTLEELKEVEDEYEDQVSNDRQRT